MRRIRSNDRGGGRGRQNISGSSRPGPLLTDHLKDIDLELELLKRKREMIEQQQSIYQPYQQQPFQKQSQRNYTQQSYDYNDNGGQSSFNVSNIRDFSHLYDDGSQYNRKSVAKKRPSDNEWQHDSFPKRSTGHGQHGNGQRGHSYSGPAPIRNQRPFTPRNEPKRGLPSKHGQGKFNSSVQMPQKNFVQKKIMKPNKSRAPPNKIASQPVSERVNLVAASLKSVAELEVRNRELNRLLPDQEPTKQVKGRLEMSLGGILNEIREVYANSPHLMTINTVPIQRKIKQTIRDRIRTAMLGKIVGSTKEIIKEYRVMFPKESDRDIVNAALTAVGISSEDQSKNVIANTREKFLEVPDNFFKENMGKLIHSHLYEMFSKMEEIYSKVVDDEPNNTQIDFTEDSFGVDATSFDTDMNTSKNEKEGTDKKNAEDTSMKDDTATPMKDDTATPMKDDTATPMKDDTATLEKEDTANLEKEDLTALEKEDTATVMKENTATATVEDNPARAEEVAKFKEVISSLNTLKEKEDTLRDIANKEKLAAAIAKGEEAAANLGTVNPSQYKFMLPRLLKRHIPQILRLLNMNKMYRHAVNEITKETRAKYEKYSKYNICNQEVLPNKTAEQALDDTSILESTPKKLSQYPLPYYVKVMGKPQLPKKKVMQPFLDMFHPKSIKKHRVIHNLLFIGFTDKNDFEAIVKANGTVIGRTTLSIRICDTSNEKEEENVNSKQEEKQATDKTIANEKQVLLNSPKATNQDSAKLTRDNLEDTVKVVSELDNQTSNLLTAVNADASTENHDENHDITPANCLKDDSEVEKAVGNEFSKDEKNEEQEVDKKVGTEISEDVSSIAVDESNNSVGDAENNPIETTQSVDTECDNKLQEEQTEYNNPETEINEDSDKVSTLPAVACKPTPTRASTRLANTTATPSSIRTRRASKLGQN